MVVNVLPLASTQTLCWGYYLVVAYLYKWKQSKFTLPQHLHITVTNLLKSDINTLAHHDPSSSLFPSLTKQMHALPAVHVLLSLSHFSSKGVLESTKTKSSCFLKKKKKSYLFLLWMNIKWCPPRTHNWSHFYLFIYLFVRHCNRWEHFVLCWWHYDIQ